ncbi:MAG: phosphatidylglycerophosphatase A [Pseudomonadota bacterium]
MTLSTFIATFAYSGFLRPAPGTWGSAAAIPALWLLWVLGGLWLVILATIAAFFAGWWATERYIATSTSHDPSEVVIDEVVGQWVALWPVALGLLHSGVSFWTLYPGILVAFLAFRLFDILKPGPIGWADRRGDALGVMLDDVFAGIAAAICVIIGGVAAHGL